jgi:crotonobetainyl-CoA:carnitine CoA-transferase CaiB-like acyl-CoA transferase
MIEPALAGIRVAAFTHFAAGPIAAQYLGALGADVIKVEAPQRDVNRYAVRDPAGRCRASAVFRRHQSEPALPGTGSQVARRYRGRATLVARPTC